MYFGMSGYGIQFSQGRLQLHMDITFKSKISSIIRGSCFILFALIIEIALIVGSKNMDSGTILLIGGNVIIILPLFIFGLFSIKNYFNDKKNIEKALDTYGLDAIKRHVASNTIKVYEKNGVKTYFTDKIIADPSQGVIAYGEIAHIYITNVNGSNTSTTMITIRTFEDESYEVCPKILIKHVKEYISLICEKNPSVLVGFTDENLQKCNELTGKYKNGEISIPKISL